MKLTLIITALSAGVVLVLGAPYPAKGAAVVEPLALNAEAVRIRDAETFRRGPVDEHVRLPVMPAGNERDPLDELDDDLFDLGPTTISLTPDPTKDLAARGSPTCINLAPGEVAAENSWPPVCDHHPDAGNPGAMQNCYYQCPGQTEGDGKCINSYSALNSSCMYVGAVLHPPKDKECQLCDNYFAAGARNNFTREVVREKLCGTNPKQPYHDMMAPMCSWHIWNPPQCKGYC